MASCRYCGKKGLFLELNDDGLCPKCVSAVSIDVSERVRVINNCVNKIDELKTIKAKIGKCEQLIEMAEYLLKYEQKGFSIMEPLPSDLISEYSIVLAQLNASSGEWLYCYNSALDDACENCKKEADFIYSPIYYEKHSTPIKDCLKKSCSCMTVYVSKKEFSKKMNTIITEYLEQNGGLVSKKNFDKLVE